MLVKKAGKREAMVSVRVVVDEEADRTIAAVEVGGEGIRNVSSEFETPVRASISKGRPARHPESDKVEGRRSRSRSRCETSIAKQRTTSGKR